MYPNPNTMLTSHIIMRVSIHTLRYRNSIKHMQTLSQYTTQRFTQIHTNTTKTHTAQIPQKHTPHKYNTTIINNVPILCQTNTIIYVRLQAKRALSPCYQNVQNLSKQSTNSKFSVFVLFDQISYIVIKNWF